MDELIASFLAIVFMGVFLRLILLVAGKLKQKIKRPVKAIIYVIIVQVIIVTCLFVTAETPNAEMNTFICVLLALSVLLEFILLGIMILSRLEQEE